MYLYNVQGLRPEVSPTEPHQEVSQYFVFFFVFVFVFVCFLYDVLEHVQYLL